jgi:hypothetical protein
MKREVWMRALLVVMLLACVFAFVLLGRNMSRQVVRVQPLPVLADGTRIPPTILLLLD